MERRRCGSRERKVSIGAIAGAMCVVLTGCHSAHRPRPASAPRDTDPSITGEALQGVTVILDPGHGGEDPGAVCGPLSEAALTYRTATEVASRLHAQGAEVIYTVHSRALDPTLALIEPPLIQPTDAVMAATNRPLRFRRSPEPLWQRAETARRIWTRRARWDTGARRSVFFLSLHYDQYRATGVSGGFVCVDRRVRPVPLLARVLAREMASGNFGRGCEFQGIPGVSGHELGVLNPAYNPVPEKVLLEVATLSNTQDALQAGDAAWRGEMARRMVDAIVVVHQQPMKSDL